jgi:hypothetical protein
MTSLPWKLRVSIPSIPMAIAQQPNLYHKRCVVIWKVLRKGVLEHYGQFAVASHYAIQRRVRAGVGTMVTCVVKGKRREKRKLMEETILIVILKAMMTLCSPTNLGVVNRETV